MDAEAILEGLNPEQRRAAEAVRGPVCILAGAGSGKTTTITRRIAYAVAVGAFAPHEVLAVTFTDKAARELRERLRRLGATGVVARTFHAAALAQLRGLSPAPPERLMASKAVLLRQIGNGLPGAYRRRPAGDLATEVEWAKARRIPPERYRRELGDHEPPIPDDLMERVYREYERRKAAAGAVDFEDLLEHAIRLFDENAAAAARFRERYRAFTVDEFQDVNLLQSELLDRWLGGRDEVCAVGDDYQAIYSFTGASPEHLLSLPARFPDATVVRLETNYRSTPQVLALANRLVPRLGGAGKELRAASGDGPEPETRGFPERSDELRFVVRRIEELRREGVPLEEVAILYRVNARSEDYEEALAAAGIAYQVRGGAFLARPAARRLQRALAGRDTASVAQAVRDHARAEGLLEEVPEASHAAPSGAAALAGGGARDPAREGLGEQEATRQADLARLVRLAEEFDGRGSLAEFLADLEARFGGDDHARGVVLLTYHAAKGLEFDAVFLPRLEEKELPIRQARTAEAVAEERRLLYVGLTRARRHLALTWAGRPSRFLAELDVRAAAPAAARPPRVPDWQRSPAERALRAWRTERARADGVPAYVVFADRTLEELVRTLPRAPAELAAVHGLGPERVRRYGEELLRVLRELPEDAAAGPPAPARTSGELPDGDLYGALAAWRRTRASEDDVPPYVVCSNRTLEEVVRRLPRSVEELLEIPGIGARKAERYGPELLRALSAALELRERRAGAPA